MNATEAGRGITVVLCDGVSDMGIDATEADVESWLAYVTQRIAAEFPGATIAMSPREGTRVMGGSEVEAWSVRGSVQIAWDEWCGGARAEGEKR